MKNIIFISCILIILFKTGNVLSNSNIFNVNNIKVENLTSKSKEIQVNLAFKKAYDKLINRILLKKDYQKIKDANLAQIKKLVSYYQVAKTDKENKKNKEILFNVSFNRERVHQFFYKNNILYSDIINTEVILFPLFIKDKKYLIFTQNYFYDNWNNIKSDYLIQYTLPVENIENIQKINLNKNKLYDIDVSNFFIEHEKDNITFAIIEVQKNSSKIFLKTRIQGKKINKTLILEKKNETNNEEFYKKIILNINDQITELIKSQNLIDVRTPSFLNVKINLNKKNSLLEFDNRIKKIELIDNFYVQELNKNYVLVKIRYLGKIDKLINKLEDHQINLTMTEGQWQLDII